MRKDIYQPNLKDLLPTRREDVHKGECGRIGIIAGSTHFLGAALLTAKAALRTGAGLVTLMSVPEASSIGVNDLPELIIKPLPSDEGCIAKEAFPLIQSWVHEGRMDVLAIGPGLGQNDSTQALVQMLLKEQAGLNIPYVIDADGLNALAIQDFSSVAKETCVLTPHLGEYRRLWDKKMPEGQKERSEILLADARACQQIVVLKGKPTWVGSEKGVFKSTGGNPGMATAGAGDVLTGIIGAFLGQGVSAADAAVLGVSVHANAGDKAYTTYGDGLIATDIIENIPASLLELSRKKDGVS